MKAVQFNEYGGPEVLRVVDAMSRMPVPDRCGLPSGLPGSTFRT